MTYYSNLHLYFVWTFVKLCCVSLIQLRGKSPKSTASVSADLVTQQSRTGMEEPAPVPLRVWWRLPPPVKSSLPSSPPYRALFCPFPLTSHIMSFLTLMIVLGILLGYEKQQTIKSWHTKRKYWHCNRFLSFLFLQLYCEKYN